MSGIKKTRESWYSVEASRKKTSRRKVSWEWTWKQDGLHETNDDGHEGEDGYNKGSNGLGYDRRAWGSTTNTNRTIENQEKTVCHRIILRKQ